jgi:23S rRNA pseudouridine1911/1915/1917 synthase
MNVIFEDNHILVAVKHVGIPVQADKSGEVDFLTQIKEYRKVHENKPGNVYVGMVHRLDRMVGGVMVFAKTSKAASRLSEQIRSQTLTKTYLAIVHGRGLPGGELNDWLLKNEHANTTSVVRSTTPGAKKALLEYRVLEEQDAMSLLLIHLITGRSHQIRVQFSSRSWPLVGDHKYGTSDTLQTSPTLWSHSLILEHPTSKERLSFYAPHPDGVFWKRFKTIKKELELSF